VTLAALRPEVCLVPHGQIDEPELPSRSEMDETKMDELVADMRANGFTSAVVLARVGERYEVIAGHRRWHAAKRAGIAALPALVYPRKVDGLEAIQFSENEYREKLTPTDEALWYAQLLERRPDEGTDGLAARLKVPRDRVERRLNLLAGDDDIFAALKAGQIKVGVAEQLNLCTRPDYRRMLLNSAIINGATVATVTGWIAEWRHTMEPALRDVPIAGTPAASGPPMVSDYFTCRACGLTTNPQNMRPVNVHDYCEASQLAPALEMFARKSDYLRWPRSLEEARALASELVARFPALVPE
jgi:ParB/RepB/Spo0J family partition protein